jgi:regulation of enolase protein 1 (concanavalin A-like superfamily)
MKFIASVISASLIAGFLILSAALVADEPPAFKDTPQEYGLVFDRPYISGDQAKVQARSGGKVFAAAQDEYLTEREKAYASTGAYPPDDDAKVEALVKKKQAVLLSNGTKVQFNQSFALATANGFATFAHVRVLGGPAKDKVAAVSPSEFFIFDTFPLKAGDEGMLGKGRLSSDEAGIAVVGEVSAFNALLKSWRDGEPRKNIALAKKAESVWFQEPGTRVKVKAVACSADRIEHYQLAGAAVSVEVLDGPDKGKVGWAFPESVLKAANEAPGAGATKAATPPGWVGLKSEKDSFAVELAGAPNIHFSEPGDGGGATIVGFKARGVEMLVGVVHESNEIPRNDKGKALSSIRDRVAAKFAGGGAKVEWPREEDLGPLRVLEFSLSVAKSPAGPLKGHGRAYAAGKTAYILMVAADRKGEQSTHEELRFFRSFVPLGHAAMAPSEESVPKPPAETKETAEVKWGSEIDPDGDVAVRLKVGELTMKVPGTPHVLAPERSMMNAPRVVSPVRGEFTVTVRVDGTFQPSDKSTVKGLSSRQAAGLILWKDEKNYLAFQRRAASGEEGKDTNQAVLEELVAGAKGVTHRPSAPVGPLFLRLEQSKGRIAAAFSSDGKDWKDLKAVDTSWAKGELQVGVIAVSTSTGPLEVKFDNYSVKTK